MTRRRRIVEIMNFINDDYGDDENNASVFAMLTMIMFQSFDNTAIR